MPDLIVDASRVVAEGEDFAKQLKQLCARFERDKGWPRERTAQALLAVTHGVCRTAGWSPAEVLNRAAEQFSACERAYENARKPG